MSSQPESKMTPEEYLAFERQSETKHEFYDGEIFAMSGASMSHNDISLNIGGELRQAFRNRTCKAWTGDLRVKLGRSSAYVYPDVVATCEEPKLEDDQLDTLTNPQVIVEVSSPSTESHDRGTKFRKYRELESLTDYVLVAQDRVSVEHFAREDDGSWRMRDYDLLTDELVLDSVDVRLPLSEIYLKVEFEQEKTT